MMDLAALYVSTAIGLICYLTATAEDGGKYKQSFFLQYIIMAVSLVLGFLTLFIAMLIISHSVMKSVQTSLFNNAKNF